LVFEGFWAKFPSLVETGVHPNAVEPGIKGGFRFKIIQISVGFYKYVLGGILGVLRISQKIIAEIIDSILMGLDNGFEGRWITGLESPDQMVFIVRIHEAHIRITNEKGFCSQKSNKDKHLTLRPFGWVGTI
jgi:hypothetical protein